MQGIRFDEVAFMNGAVAIDSIGRERFYAGPSPHPTDCDFTTKIEGMTGTYTPMRSELTEWTMKPTSPQDEVWIMHDGGPCPIPWAKAGEWARLFLDGSCDDEEGYEFSAIESTCWMSDSFVAYRLTNGWLPVKGDGTIPEGIKGAKAGEWEAKYRDGYVNKPDTSMFDWKHDGAPHNIVAVRRIKKEEIREATQCKFCDTPIDNEEGIIGEVCCDVCDENYEYISPLGKNDLPVCASLPETFNHLKEQETPQQRLTREAYLRYKAAHPDPLPAPPAMGQDGIESAIFAALCESMRKEWR